MWLKYLLHFNVLITFYSNKCNFKKGNSSFLYSAVSSSKHCTLFALPGRPVHSDTNSASPGSILAMQQLPATTNHSHFHHCSQVLIQLSQWREQKYPIFETVAKGDSNPGSLDCESGILPLSYRLINLYIYEEFGHKTR